MRITPAYAGKTHAESPKSRGTEDHPRVCGENRSQAIFRALRKGSPPRMRGKPFKYLGGSVALRITPAYAGKTNDYSERK